MKVRMLTTKCGPDGGWNAGQVLERSDADAKKLIDAGLAAAHRPTSAVEKATAGPQRGSESTKEQRR